MPTLDLPLAELYQYQGTNPRPLDFDEYWARGLAEMRAVDSAVELVPASFQSQIAECFDLFYTGVGGSRIHAKYLRPRVRSGRKPAIVQFHGYSLNSGNWYDKLAWVAEGFSVAALDCRGQGGLSQDLGGVTGNTHRGQIIRGLDAPTPDQLLFRQIFLDTAQLVRIVSGFAEVDPDRIGAMGASQGGGLALACAALAPQIKRVAPVYPFLSDYQRVWEMDLAANAYEDIRNYFRLFDPTHAREEQVFTRLGYIDVQHLAPRIQGQVLMAATLMDNICPPSTQFAAYNKIRSPKSIMVYPDYAHEPELPGFKDATFEFLRKL